MAARKNAILYKVAVVCAIISLAGYCYDGDIPVLSIFGLTINNGDPPPKRLSGTNKSRTCECDCTRTATIATQAESSPKITNESAVPYDTPPDTPQVNKLVPLNVLRKRVAVTVHNGMVNLDHPSLSRYYECERKSSSAAALVLDQEEKAKDGKICAKQRTFLDRKHPITALVSFHGSGNTWVRHLLEQVTGAFTGSVYCDPTLRVYFPGEYIVSGNVVAVKTHRGDSRKLPKDMQMETGQETFDRAIVVIRNPYDTLVSEANRRWNSKLSVNSHVGLADETTFISNSKWDWFIEYKGAAWSFLIHTWLSHSAIPVHVVQYERMQTSLRDELEKILQFIDFNVSNETLDCVIENSEGSFKRTEHLKFDPYSRGNREALNRFIRQATPLLAKYGIKYSPR